MKLSINADITERLNTEDIPDVLTVHEVSKLLGICRVSVCKQIALGNIAAFKKGRNYYIPKNAVIKFVCGRSESAL